VLNAVSAKECREFIAQLTGQNSWWVYGFSGEAVARIAGLLDEPEATVRSFWRENLQLPPCYGTFSFGPQKVDHYHKVSYCPECRRIGYHALFHEFGWLKQCPIHCVDLVRVDLGADFSRAYFDAYVWRIWNIFDGDTGKSLSAFDTPKVREALARPTLKAFLDWLHSVQTLSEAACRHNVVSFGRAYRYQDTGVLVGRLEWTHPLPTELKGIFCIPPQQQEPMISDCNIDAARALEDLLGCISYRDLSWFYRMTAILARQMPFARRVVIETVRTIASQERGTKWQWGWLRNVGWVSVDPSGWPYWQVMTPRDVVVRRLREKWIDFSLKDSSPQQSRMDWLNYVAFAIDLSKRGIVTGVGSHAAQDGGIRPTTRMQPFVAMAIDSNVRELLDLLQYQEALADLDYARQWLQSVRRGEAPLELPRTAVSHGNLFLEDDRAYLMIWPMNKDRIERGDRWRR
jgi:hypothetical protein